MKAVFYSKVLEFEMLSTLEENIKETPWNKHDYLSLIILDTEKQLSEVSRWFVKHLYTGKLQQANIIIDGWRVDEFERYMLNNFLDEWNSILIYDRIEGMFEETLKVNSMFLPAEKEYIREVRQIFINKRIPLKPELNTMLIKMSDKMVFNTDRITELRYRGF